MVMVLRILNTKQKVLHLFNEIMGVHQSNHYAIHLKLIQCYMSSISQKVERNNGKNMYQPLV